MSVIRWLKREHHRCRYQSRYCVKVSLMLVLASILLIQMYSLMTSHRKVKGSVEFKGGHYVIHGDEDDDDDVNHHYYMAVDAHKRRKQVRNVNLEQLIVLNNTEKEKLDYSLRNTHYLKVKTSGRLGNSMFAYASLLGVSSNNYMIPVLAKDDLLWKYFNLKATVLEDVFPEKKNWPSFLEKSFTSTYDGRTQRLNYTMDIELVGYFQSWRYFWNIRDTIRREFLFKYEIKSFAEEYIQNVIFERLGPEILERDVTFVGIHVRRGDMLEPHNIEKGYTVAPREYIMTAIKYFEDSLDPERLVFVVCSDDMIWVKTNIRPQRAPMVHSLFHDAIQDLAILSHCHHVITTVGTYSWWAGFLSRGKVIYYKHFPRPGSSLASAFVPEDYYLPEWIGLGNKDFVELYLIYFFFLLYSSLNPF